MNPTYRFNCSLAAAGERISVLEDKSGENPEQSKDRLKDGKHGEEDKCIKDTIRESSIFNWSPQRREVRAQLEAILEVIMAEEFPKTYKKKLIDEKAEPSSVNAKERSNKLHEFACRALIGSLHNLSHDALS